MITLTRLDGRELVVNAGHLLLVEKTPDTVIVLTTGQRIMVREPVQTVVDRVVAFRQRIVQTHRLPQELPYPAVDSADEASPPPTEEAEI